MEQESVITGPLQESSIVSLGVNVTKLTISSASLKTSDALLLASALRSSNAKIRFLDLSKNSIQDVGASAVVKCEALYGSLEHIDLSSNRIGDLGAVSIAEQLRMFPHLWSFVFENNDVTKDGARVLGKHLGRCANLNSLRMSQNARLGDVGGALILNGLEESFAIQRVELSQCGLGVFSSISIGKLLEKSLTLQALILSHNDLTGKGSAAIAKGLAASKSLTTLDLSDNSLSASSAIDMALTVASTSDGCSPFAEVLADCPTLMTLNLGGNGIGKQGMKAIADALLKNKTLSRLLLTPKDRLSVLAKGLVKNYSVTTVFPSNYSAEDALALPDDLLKLLRRNILVRRDLEEALAAGNAGQVVRLLGQGVDLNEITRDGNSVMHLAVLGGEKCVEVMLKHPACMLMLSWQDAKGHTPVEVALNIGLTEVVNVMLQTHGVLHVLVRNRGSHRYLKRLLTYASASTLNHTDHTGRTPYHVAIELGNLDLLKVMHAEVKCDTKVLFRGLSPFLVAILNGHEAVCELLLSNDPKVAHHLSPKGRTALHLAASVGSAKICELLLHYGCQANCVTADAEMKAPMHFCTNPQVVHVLADHGASVNITSSSGESALAAALARSDIDVISALLDRGADRAKAFENITTLNVENQFRLALPAWLGSIPNLKTLQCVQGNPLTSIPSNIVKEGDDAVLQYLRDIGSFGNKTTWNSVKVMVLGKEGVGKTHIRHLVSGKKYLRNESTDGIDVQEFQLKSGTRVKWFDFGGQEVFYPTHQFFLTSQCVYLVVFNIADDDFEQRVSYWLRCVESISAESRNTRVVVVGTHLDLVKEERAQAVKNRLQILVAESAFVTAHTFLSCTNDAQEVVEQISRGIDVAAQQAGLAEREVPKSYLAVMQWAKEKLKNGVTKMSWEEVLEEFPGFDALLLQRACVFLHDMGELFFSKTSNFLCFDVQWLARLFSSLLTFRHNWVKNGVVRNDEMVHIWKDNSPAEIAAVLSLFEKFHVAFRRRSDDVWVIPALLPEDPPQGAFATLPRVTHRRVYKFRVLPSGVFGRMLSRIMEWKVDVMSLSRYLIVLSDGDKKASLGVVDNDLQLDFFEGRAAKKSKVSLLRRLDDEVRSVLQLVYEKQWKLPFACEITCPHCLRIEDDNPTILDYSDCVGLILSGDRVFKCKGRSLDFEELGEDLSFQYVDFISSDRIRIDDEPFASGGFGDVYKGNFAKQEVAVKQVRVGAEKDQVEVFWDFQRETSVMGQLVHPNLLKLVGVMFSPLRMVIEFCSKGDLLHALRARQVVKPHLKIRLATDIARGMAYLHSQNPPLAHRDLRSPNVFLVSLDSNDLCAKVADFGLTVSVSTFLADPLLTWQWMAPEAYLGRTYDERCDLYSFGVVLWEICHGNGDIPFEEFIPKNDPKFQTRDLIRRVHETEHLRPTIAPDFVPVLSTLMQVLWAPQPEKRPAFYQCLLVLEKLISPVGGSPSTSAPQKRAKPWIIDAASNRSRRVAFSVRPDKVDLSFCSECILCFARVVHNGKETFWFGGELGGVFCVSSIGTVFLDEPAAHGGPVRALCLGPDEKVWSAGEDGRIMRWRADFGFSSAPKQQTKTSGGSSSSVVAADPTETKKRTESTWSKASVSRESADKQATKFKIATKVPDLPPRPDRVSPRPMEAPPSPRGELTKSSPRATEVKPPSPRPQTSQPLLGNARQSMRHKELIANVHAGQQILTMQSTYDTVVTGDSNGALAVWKAGSEKPDLVLRTRQQWLQPVVTAGWNNQSKLFCAGGKDFFRVVTSARTGTSELELLGSHSDSRISRLIGVGASDVWTCSKQEMRIWDGEGRPRKEIVDTDTHFHCIASVVANGWNTVWCGCNDEIRVYDPDGHIITRIFDFKGDIVEILDCKEEHVMVCVRDTKTALTTLYMLQLQ